MAISMQFLQKMCPHFVVVSSTNGSMQIAHRNFRSAGVLLLFSAGAEGITMSVFTCNKEITVQFQVLLNKDGKMMLISD